MANFVDLLSQAGTLCGLEYPIVVKDQHIYKDDAHMRRQMTLSEASKSDNLTNSIVKYFIHRVKPDAKSCAIFPLAQAKIGYH
jgi:hypothetical protein